MPTRSSKHVPETGLAAFHRGWQAQPVPCPSIGASRGNSTQQWRSGNCHKPGLGWGLQSLGSANCICFASTWSWQKWNGEPSSSASDELPMRREAESFRPCGFMLIQPELEWVLYSGPVCHNRCHGMYNQVFWGISSSFDSLQMLPQLQHRTWLWKYHHLAKIYADFSWFHAPDCDIIPAWRFSPNIATPS